MTLPSNAPRMPSLTASGTTSFKQMMTTPESSIDPNFKDQAARHYDPTCGRWLSEEPLGFAADESNLYRYVHQPITEGQ
jgi:RHS repeat-associated protein